MISKAILVTATLLCLATPALGQVFKPLLMAAPGFNRWGASLTVRTIYSRLSRIHKFATKPGWRCL